MKDIVPPLQTIVLIPAYQPRQTLVDMTNQLVAANFVVVVVDDGSGVEYQSIFNALDDRIRLITHDVNRGKGVALKTGYRHIRDTYQKYIIITADADGQHHIDDIQKMTVESASRHHALLLGSRTFENDNVPFKNRFGNVMTRRVFWLITGQKIRDTQTGLRAFDESLMDFMLRVPGERFEYEMNVLLACSREGIALAELPIETIYENQGSHFHPLKDSWSIYKEVCKFALSSALVFGIDYLVFITILYLTDSWSLASSVVFANIIARIVSTSFNFTMNKRLVFGQKAGAARNILYYIVLACGVLLGNTMLLHFLTSSLDIAPYIAKIVTEIAFLCLSYLVQMSIKKPR